MLINLLTEDYIDIYKQIKKEYFEVLGYKNIILYMIQNDMQNTEQYVSFFSDYLIKLTMYEITKEHFGSILKEKNSDINWNTWNILFEKDAVQLD